MSIIGRNLSRLGRGTGLWEAVLGMAQLPDPKLVPAGRQRSPDRRQCRAHGEAREPPSREPLAPASVIQITVRRALSVRTRDS